jgi:hypothetical protein
MLAAGPALIAFVGSAAPGPVLAACVLPIGVGFGLLSPPLLSAVTGEFPQSDQPIAVGTFNVLFFFGGAVGAALSTAFVQQGFALGIFDGWPLPAYASAELLLCVAPLVAAAAALRWPGGAAPAASAG